MMQQARQAGRRAAPAGRGNTAPVYPWFGKDIREGLSLALENYNLLHRLWREDVVDSEAKYRTPLQGFTSIPRPLDDVPPFVWHGSIRTPEIAEQAAPDDQMRPLFAYLRTLIAPTSLFAAPEDWSDPDLNTRIDRAALELVLLVESGFARKIKDQSWHSYRHENGSAGGTELSIDLDTDLMRLATGGSAR